MKRMKSILACSLIFALISGSCPVFIRPAAAADVEVNSVFIERTDNEVLETVQGVIEIDGSGLKDAMVRVRTTAGGGTKILGTELGSRVSNEESYLKFELTGAEMKSILLADGINIGGLLIAVDESDYPTINSVEPKVVYLGGDSLAISGSNLDQAGDDIAFGNGTLNGTVNRTPSLITVSNLSGDTGFHDIIFTRVNTSVPNVQPGGGVTIRRLYQNQFRVVQDMNIPDLEMYPNKGVPGKTTVYFRAENLDKCSVFFVRNSSDPFDAANMGTHHEYIPSPLGDDLIKVRVPSVTPGTYRVYLTNFLTNPPGGTDLRNLITKQQMVGDFLVVSSGDAAEIVSVSPAQGPNLSSNAVTIVGYNLEELIIEGLTMDDPGLPGIARAADNKSLGLDYGSGTYQIGAVPKTVQVTRTIRVIIGKDAEFQEEDQQSFANQQYDTLRILTATLPNSEIEEDPAKDVIMELDTLIRVEGSDEVYEFRETAVRENGFLFIKSYTEPAITEVIPRNIQVTESMGSYVTKEELVLSVTGRDFLVTKYTDSETGQESFYYPMVDLGGAICLKRESRDGNRVLLKNLHPLNPPADDWVELSGASLEVLEGSVIMDGSAGKELGSRMVIKIPAGVEVLEDRLNFSTYVEVTNPKRNSSEYGYPIRKDDAVQFVVVGEGKTPVITSVDPHVVATEGEKGVQIHGYNFQADVKVYLDGLEIKGSKRDPSSQLITFDAPPGREGETRLMVMNPEGGTDSAPFIYVKTQTNPKITGVSPPEGTIGTLVVISGDVFLEPDPTATPEGIGIYRLLGTRVLFDNMDVNDYRYRQDTTVIEPQGYVAPAGQKLLTVSGGSLILADYHPSILLRDSQGQYYVVKRTASGQPVLTDGVHEWFFSSEGASISATDQSGAQYSVSLGGSPQQDEITLTRNGTDLVWQVLTPYAVNSQGVITGHRVRVVDGGERLLVTVPDLQVQGLYDVTVVNPDTKKATLNDGFRFYRSPQRVPVITAIVPNCGSTDGGYYIEIQGENFEETQAIKTRVFINAVEIAQNDTVVNPDGTSMRVKVPPYPGDLRQELGVDHKAVPVAVLNPSDGGSTGLPEGFTYLVPTSQPIIDTLSRTEGSAAGGDYVQIIGRDFRFYEPYEDNNGNFQFDELEDDYTDLNGNHQWDDLRRYASVEDIPETERELMLPILPRVYFGKQTAQVLDFGSNFIGVSTPRSPAGPVSVYVVNNDYGVSNTKPFAFQGSTPKITSLIPNVGKKQGGEPVEIHGSGFAAGSVSILQEDGSLEERHLPLVRFGSLAGVAEMTGGRVSNMEVEGYLKVDFDANQDTLTLTLQPSADRLYQQTYTYDGSDRYVELKELLAADGAAYNGLEMVRVRVVQEPGNKLRVERGYAPVASLVSSGQVLVTTPTYYTVGQVPVSLINPDGAVSTGSFTYRNPDSRPRITNITRDDQPPQLTEVEGKQVKVLRMNYSSQSEVCVFGEDFRENAVIQVGNLLTIPPDKITYTLPNKLVFTMPDIAEDEIGKLHRLVVINEDGGTAASDQPASGLETDKIYLQFTKGETLPAVGQITPALGPASGQTRVKIEGQDFRAVLDGYGSEALQVYFGGQKATELEVADYKTIWATTPANLPGTWSVRVENPDGEISQPDGSFTYISVPRVTALIDPTDTAESKPIDHISIEGGQEIKVKGSGFMPGARVVFAPELEKAGPDAGGDIVYRIAVRQEGSYSSAIIDPYLLKSGSSGSDVKYIDGETLTVKTPPGKVDTKGLMVINPDQGASDPYEDIAFQLPELEAPSGKVYAEIVYDRYNHTDLGIRVVWNPVTGADQYEILVVEDEQTDFIASTHLTSYLFEDIKPRTRYRFIVKAVGNYGSSPPSAESNTVKTGSTVGRPDEDGKPGERTEVKRQGATAYVNIGSRDDLHENLLVDLTRGPLAGASQVAVHIPASVAADSRSGTINILGSRFSLKFQPQVFKTARVMEHQGRDDAGIRFQLMPVSAIPLSAGNSLSPIYQLESVFCLGQEQSRMDYLAGTMVLQIDYDQAKAKLRRFQEVGLYRQDAAGGTWSLAPALTPGSPAAGIHQMGLYTVMGTRR